jgi:glycosyltransferase involved in cell wall biosynthesis
MISVVICTANPRVNHIHRAVASVLAQELDETQWELLVIDNASDPSVEELGIITDSRVRVVREPRPGLTAAKERGAREAMGEVIVFVDDDNVLAPDYLTVVGILFESARVGVLGPSIEPEYEVEPPAWFTDPHIESSIVVRRLPNNRLYASTVPETSAYFPSGAGSCVRRDVLTSYFDSLTHETRIEGRLGRRLTGGEDWDIGMYAIAEGYLVGSCGRLRLTHLIPPSRLNPAYLTSLVIGSLDGAERVNDKWKPVFGHDVVPYFRASPLTETAKAALHMLFAVSPRHRILGRFHLHLAYLLWKRRRRS